MYKKKVFIIFYILILFSINSAINSKNQHIIDIETFCPDAGTIITNGSCLAFHDKDNQSINIFLINNENHKINLMPISIISENKNNDINLLDISLNGQYLAVVNNDKDELIIYEFDSKYSIKSKSIIKNLFDQPHALSFSSDNNYLAVGDKTNNNIKIFSFDNSMGHIKNLISTIPHNIKSSEALAFSDDNKLFAVANSDTNSVEILSSQSDYTKVLFTIPTETSPSTIKFSPDGHLAIAYKNITEENYIILYELDSESLQAHELFKIGPEEGINQLHDFTFNPNNNIMIIHDDIIRTYNIEKNKQTDFTQNHNRINKICLETSLNNINSDIIENTLVLGIDPENKIQKHNIWKTKNSDIGLKASIKASPLTIKQNGKIKLIGMASDGTPPYVYEWQKPNGATISGQILMINNAKPQDSGIYTLTVIDSNNYTNKVQTDVKITSTDTTIAKPEEAIKPPIQEANLIKPNLDKPKPIQELSDKTESQENSPNNNIIIENNTQKQSQENIITSQNEQQTYSIKPVVSYSSTSESQSNFNQMVHLVSDIVKNPPKNISSSESQANFNQMVHLVSDIVKNIIQVIPATAEQKYNNLSQNNFDRLNNTKPKNNIVAPKPVTTKPVNKPINKQTNTIIIVKDSSKTNRPRIINNITKIPEKITVQAQQQKTTKEPIKNEPVKTSTKTQNKLDKVKMVPKSEKKSIKKNEPRALTKPEPKPIKNQTKIIDKKIAKPETIKEIKDAPEIPIIKKMPKISTKKKKAAPKLKKVSPKTTGYPADKSQDEKNPSLHKDSLISNNGKPIIAE